MIYPNNEVKRNWDAVITLLLLITCMITPYRLAFSGTDPPFWLVVNMIVDLMFAIDIILSFLTAYYTDEYELVDNRCAIAKSYLMSWFIIDFVAIIPFENIIQGNSEESSSANVNDMIRLARLGRLYKILRLMRLFRFLKLGKSLKSILSKV